MKKVSYKTIFEYDPKTYMPPNMIKARHDVMLSLVLLLTEHIKEGKSFDELSNKHQIIDDWLGYRDSFKKKAELNAMREKEKDIKYKEALAKLSPEEIKAFGLTKNRKKTS
jgi:hypothetical protein